MRSDFVVRGREDRHPILASSCPDDLHALLDWASALGWVVPRSAVEEIEWRGQSKRVRAATSREIAPVAERIFVATQQELWSRSPGPLPGKVAEELFTVQRTAIAALRLASRGATDRGHGKAKRRLIEISPASAHLEVCYGSLRPTATVAGQDPAGGPTLRGDLAFRIPGCRCVFEAPSRDRGRMWPTFCPDCRKRNGKSNPGRTRARELRSIVNETVRGVPTPFPTPEQTLRRVRELLGPQ